MASVDIKNTDRYKELLRNKKFREEFNNVQRSCYVKSQKVEVILVLCILELKTSMISLEG